MLSEPWTTLGLHQAYLNNRIPLDEYRRLLRSCVRLLCKVEEGEEVDLLAVKMNAMVAPQYKIIKEMFPQFKMVFSTRHPKPSMK